MRRAITIDDIFYNESYNRYFALFLFIFYKSRSMNFKPKKKDKKIYAKYYGLSEKVEFKHLCYFLCKYHGLKLKNLDLSEKEKKTMRAPYKNKPFPVKQRLNDALVKLQELNLIEKTKPKKGSPYYTITSFGYREYLKFMIHQMIDYHFPEDPNEGEKLMQKIDSLLPGNFHEKKIISFH